MKEKLKVMKVPDSGDTSDRGQDSIDSTMKPQDNKKDSIEDRESTQVGIKKGESILGIGGGKVCPPIVGAPADYVVHFEENDRLNPQNFSAVKKLIIVGSVLSACFTSTFGSAVLSEATTMILEEFHVGVEVSTLCTSLFVLGYASGPVLWGPLSEVFGRKVVLIPTCFIYAALTFAVATAKDIQTLIICRFFSGFVSAAPMVIVAAILADVFDHKSRGNAVTLFAMILFGGPMLAPIINGFIVRNHNLGWRWCGYVTGIICCLSLVMTIFFYEETHPGVVLSRKAKCIREKTGNWAVFAEHDNSSLSPNEIVLKAITRPLRMLFLEPILTLITIYNSFIFGLLYLLLTAIPYVYGSSGYGFGQGVSLLPYISTILGVEAGGLINFAFDKRYLKIMSQKGKLVPEERLISMIVGGIVFPIGLFWLAWSGQYPDKVHWIVPTLALFPVGTGLICIFLPSLSYLIECYLPYAASAMSANTMVRYAFGAAFPLFSRQMFVNLNVNWGTSLLGFTSLLLLPVPLLFYRYGKALRTRSQYSLKD